MSEPSPTTTPVRAQLLASKPKCPTCRAYSPRRFAYYDVAADMWCNLFSDLPELVPGPPPDDADLTLHCLSDSTKHGAPSTADRFIPGSLVAVYDARHAPATRPAPRARRTTAARSRPAPRTSADLKPIRLRPDRARLRIREWAEAGGASSDQARTRSAWWATTEEDAEFEWLDMAG